MDLDRRFDPSHGLLRSLPAGRPAGGFPHVPPGMAQRAPASQPGLLRGHRAGPASHRGAQSPYLWAGHRVGWEVAAPNIRDRRGAPPPPRTPSRRAGRPGLGAALALDVDIAFGHAIGGTRSGPHDADARGDSPFHRRVRRPIKRPGAARTLLERRRRSPTPIATLSGDTKRRSRASASVATSATRGRW